MNQLGRLSWTWQLLAGVLALLPASQLHGQAARPNEMVRSGDMGESTSPTPSKSAAELKCAIVDWTHPAPKPVLTIVCPPEQVFAPLRIYLGLSWEKREDIPEGIADIVAPPNSAVQVEFRQTEARVRLRTQKTGNKKGKESWVSFSEITKIALSTGL